MAASEVVIDYPSTERGSGCPYPVYDHWRREAPVYRLPDRPDVHVVSRYEDVVHVARHPETFSSAASRSGLNGFDFVGDAAERRPSMMESDPPEHRARRDLVFGAVKPGRLREHAPWITEVVDRLIDRFAERGSFDFVRELARPLPVEVMLRLFAIPDEDRPLILEWSDLEVSGLTWSPPEVRERMLRNAHAIGEYLTALVERRRADPGDDVVSETIRAQVDRDGAFDLGEVRAQVSVLLAGGAATTQHMLGGAMLLLLRHPTELERARQEPKRIGRILEEAMRLESSVQWVPRVVVHDTELAGVPLPAGSYVLVMFASANRDPARFDRADAFDPDRENLADHVAFGSGPHTCIGAPLARLEGRIAFERLLTRLHGIRRITDDEPRRVPSASFRGLESLPLAFELAP